MAFIALSNQGLILWGMQWNKDQLSMPKDFLVFGSKILSTDSSHGCVIFSPTSAFVYKLNRFRLFSNVPRPILRIFPIRTDLLYNPRPAVAQQCHKRLSQMIIYLESFVNQCLMRNSRPMHCWLKWTGKWTIKTYKIRSSLYSVGAACSNHYKKNTVWRLKKLKCGGSVELKLANISWQTLKKWQPLYQ